MAGGLGTGFDPFGNEARRYPGPGITLADYRTMGPFAIKADTILASLANKETDAFRPSGPLPMLPERQNRVVWHQSDYLQVANAAFDFEWKEPASNWGLYAMLFDTPCQDDNAGFSRAFIIYYKSFWQGLIPKYTTREIDVYPQVNSVEWGGRLGLSSFNHRMVGDRPKATEVHGR